MVHPLWRGVLVSKWPARMPAEIAIAVLCAICATSMAQRYLEIHGMPPRGIA